MSDELRDKRLRSETQISEQLDERLTMNGNKRYYRLILNKNILLTLLIITTVILKSKSMRRTVSIVSAMT